MLPLIPNLYIHIGNVRTMVLCDYQLFIVSAVICTVMDICLALRPLYMFFPLLILYM
jgi:hypothetical protein